MKKKVIFLVLTLVFCLICFNFGKLFKSDVLDSEIKESKPVNDLGSLNTLSMMIETEAGSGEYTMETRSSWPTEGYVFNENLSKCENGSTLSWNKENNVIVVNGRISDKCYIYFDKEILLLTEWIKEQYTAQTEDNKTIYLHDSSLENGAGDNSYRYSGSSSSVDNYVCFGSDEETCPHDSLYRIIGVFDDRVRLIKADYATSDMLGTDTSDYGTYNNYTSYYQGESSNLANIAGYYWNKVNYNASYSATNYYNDWSYSELNKTHLNKNYINYLNNINTKWVDMIDTTIWKVGGFNAANTYPSTQYTREIISPSDQVTNTYSSKIGLMYVSDYEYAASPVFWKYVGYSNNSTINDYRIATGENWVYMGLYEWTISRSTSDYKTAYDITAYGYVPAGYIDSACAIRPVFHLVSSITYVSGNGTKTSPIRIN